MKVIATLATVSLLTACMNLSGLDAKNKFECKAPDGVLCQSMSGIYANAEANNLPAQQIRARSTNGRDASKVEALRSHAVRKLPMPNSSSSGKPIYRNPELLRIWVAPWEAADRTLYDQNYMYLVVNDGGWQIEHNRNQIRDAFAPIQAPKMNTPTPLSKVDDSRRLPQLPNSSVEDMAREMLNQNPQQ